jgi:hypothetical protein
MVRVVQTRPGRGLFSVDIYLAKWPGQFVRGVFLTRLPLAGFTQARAC